MRSPHAHARILDIDVTGALDVDGPGRDLHLRGPRRPHGGRAAAAADPAPDADARPDAVRAGHGRGEPRRRGGRDGGGDEPVRRRGRRATGSGWTTSRCRRSSASRRRGRPSTSCTTTCPATSRRVMVQQTGDADAAIDAAPHRLELRPRRSSAARRCRWRARACYARWDADDQSLRVHTSTQTSTSVRQAIAAKLGLPVDRVEVVTPGRRRRVRREDRAPVARGGAGARGPRVRLRPAGEVDRGPARALHLQRARARPAAPRAGRVRRRRAAARARRCEFWHDNGAYTPYGLIVPIITSTQLLGPYKPGRLPGRVPLALHQHRDRDALPGRRPAAGLLRDGAGDGRDRRRPRPRPRPSCASATSSSPTEMPYDQGLMFQDGRPLIYDSGDFPASLAKLKELVGWDDFAAFREQAPGRGTAGRDRDRPATSRAPASGPTRAGTSGSRPTAASWSSTGLTSQGQGHQTMLAQIVADELGVPFDADPGDHRRHPAVQVRRRHVRLPHRGDERQRGGADRPRRCGQKALRDRGAGAGGEPRRPGDRRRRGAGQGRRRRRSQIDLGAVAVLSNPLRYAFDEAAARATQFAAPADPRQPPVGPGESPGLEGTDYYSPPRSTFANGMHAVVVETDPETAEIRILRYCVVHDCGTLINPMIVEGQIHGGVAQGVGGALYERMEYAADGQLLNASFMDFLMPYASEVPDDRDRPPGHAVAAEPAGRQGRRRGRRHPRLGRDRRGHRGRRGHHDHPDADLAQRAVRRSRQSRERGTHEDHRQRPALAADRAVVWRGAQRPGGAGAVHPRLPAARGARRRRVHDDGRGRGRLHQGRVRRAGAAHRPAAARLVPHARAGRRRRGHDRRPTCS